MATGFKLVVAAPKTGNSNAFTTTFTAADNVVQRVEVELKKEKGRLSFMTADLTDPKWAFLSSLPDITFFDIPIQLYMSKPGNPSSITYLVFDGLVTAYDSAMGGALTTTQIVAHDKSFKSRIAATTTTYKNKTSVDIAKLIASRYGWDVDATKLGDVKLQQRAIDTGMAPSGKKFFSDWDQLHRALNADGLVVHMKGNKLTIHQAATVQYSHTFRPDDGLVKHLQLRINHVRGPGGLGNVSTPVPFDSTGVDKAMAGAVLAEANAANGGSGKTHRPPIGGAASSASGSHREDITGSKWENKVTHFRGRKDELTMQCLPVPDLALTNLINMDGVGSKANGLWEVMEIKHQIVPTDGGGGTEVMMKRGVSHQAALQAGIVPFAYSGVSK